MAKYRVYSDRVSFNEDGSVASATQAVLVDDYIKDGIISKNDFGEAIELVHEYFESHKRLDEYVSYYSVDFASFTGHFMIYKTYINDDGKEIECLEFMMYNFRLEKVE